MKGQSTVCAVSGWGEGGVVLSGFQCNCETKYRQTLFFEKKIIQSFSFHFSQNRNAATSGKVTSHNTEIKY